VARKAKPGGRWPPPVVPSQPLPALRFQGVRRAAEQLGLERRLPLAHRGLMPARSHSCWNYRSFGSDPIWSIWPTSTDTGVSWPPSRAGSGSRDGLSNQDLFGPTERGGQLRSRAPLGDRAAHCAANAVPQDRGCPRDLPHRCRCDLPSRCARVNSLPRVERFPNKQSGAPTPRRLPRRSGRSVRSPSRWPK